MLLELLIAVVVLAAVAYVITLIPMPPWLRTAALVVVGVVAIVYLLRLLPGMGVDLP